MNVHDDNRAYFVLMRSEHRNVNKIVCRITTAIRLMQDPITNNSTLAEAEVVEQLIGLRKELQHHFSVEEYGGCLDEAVARCPSIGREVDAIKGEYPRLLKQLGSLIAQASHVRQPGMSHFREQWDQFVAEIFVHENAEDQLLSRGLHRRATAR